LGVLLDFLGDVWVVVVVCCWGLSQLSILVVGSWSWRWWVVGGEGVFFCLGGVVWVLVLEEGEEGVGLFGVLDGVVWVVGWGLGDGVVLVGW
jgi:hypothetical protein